jgi:hypothetical protein
MNLIDQRAAQFPGNGPVVNDFRGIVDGQWRMYVGRPPKGRVAAFALGFNTRTGFIAQGLSTGIRDHPTQPGVEILVNFKLLSP